MEQILSDIRHIIEEARSHVGRSINHEMTTLSIDVQQPFDIKDPTVLEFLGLKPEASYYETEIEEAIL